MRESDAYYLAFSHCLGIGPVKFALLLRHFGSVEKAYLAEKSDLQDLLGGVLTEKFIRFRNEFDPVKKLEELEHKKISVIGMHNPSYPKSLLNISDPPICIYVKGNFKGINFSKDHLFAVVGTRKTTSYGEKIGYKFSRELSRAGFIIVSGMALGIDTIAHKAALDEGGKTIAVLGCGVDIIYPPTNRNLYENIIQSGGLIISEFPPGHTVLKGLFVARNRLISALSRGVLVVEGAKDSGSLITARFAAEQGKDVFAPPSPLTSEMSEAPHFLLKKGAKLVTSIDDILEEFNLKMLPIQDAEIEKNLNQHEKIIFSTLKTEPKLSDELAIQLELSIDAVLHLLSMLEIKGIVEKNKEGRYQLKA